MQNMYMTPLRYKNFSGVEKNVQLHFHITPREFADWMIDNKEAADKLAETFSEMQPQLENNPDGEATTDQKLAMLQLVRLLAEMAYGKPSEDGEYFDKSDTKKFAYSAAYDAFRLFLFENPKELVTFIQTLLNDQVVREFSSKMAALANAQVDAEVAASQANTAQLQAVKDPKDMSREELLEAMRARNNQ